MERTTDSRTMFNKIWEQHLILSREPGPSLLYVDRIIVHEGSFHAFAEMRRRKLTIRSPSRVFGVCDHYVPTNGRTVAEAADENVAAMISRFEANMQWGSIPHFSLDDPRQGIVHVVGPEQGLTLPGLIMLCSDSHTTTHGALGAIAFGIGQSENVHAMATQTSWQLRPRNFRIFLGGRPCSDIFAKDVILAIIARIGADGANGYAVEFAGPCVERMTIEERLTVCNMAVEAGARCGIVAPDDKTYSYLYGRPLAPIGQAWEDALRYWRTLPSAPDAHFDREIVVDCSKLEPMVTWGTSSEDALPITACVPDPRSFRQQRRRDAAEAALQYMDLTPGTPLTEIRIDRVFIGSCTNARLEDLRAAAAVLNGRRALVPGIVVPGSGLVKKAAEAEGLHRIFLNSGLEWREAGCSMCVAMNGDIVSPGQRCASTSNRNFMGRQGPGSRTHLMSPAMAAAAAIAGHLADVRQFTRH